MKDEAKRIMEELFSMGEEEANEVLKEVGVDLGKTQKAAEGAPKVEEEPQEQLELEPVVKKEEPKEEKQSGAEEMMKAKEKGVDPIIEILKAMSPQERAAWAAKEGPEAVLKLMEFQQLEIDRKMQEMATQQKRQVLDTVIQDWAKENKEILEDPLIGSLAEGLDMALLKKAGYASYLELSPTQLSEHLNQVASLLRKLKEAGVSGKILKGGDVKEGKQEGREETKQEEEMPVHIGDLGPGGGGMEITADALERLANDPTKFEEVIAKIPERKLAEMLAGA